MNGQHPQQVPDRRLAAGRLPSIGWFDGQRERGGGQQSDVDAALDRRAKKRFQNVGVQIAAEQQNLEKALMKNPGGISNSIFMKALKSCINYELCISIFNLSNFIFFM